LRIKPKKIQTSRRISINTIKHWISGSCLVTFVCPNVVVSDDDMKLFPSSLTVLDLGFDQKLTNNAIKNLPRGLKQLKLCHANVGNVGINYLPPILTHLTFKNSNRVTDVGLKNLPNTLTHLDLYSNNSISDKGIRNLPPNLTYLCLHENNNVTSEGLKYLPKTLNYLDVHENTWIDDEGIKNLPLSITYLDLHYAKLVSNSGLIYLPPRLTHLDLFMNKNVSLDLKHLPQSLTTFYAKSSRLIKSS